MRPRAGTQPVTLEPSRVVELLQLARDHDELLKGTRQDLFQAETKLRMERKWKWPIRLACVALGVAGLGAAENEALMANVAEGLGLVGRELQSKANAALVTLVLLVAGMYGAIHLLRRMWRKPSPEKQARKLMEQFAQRDGVAAYVFADENADDVAESIGALTRVENKQFRQRRLNATNRTLSSAMTRVLHRIEDDVSEPLLH